MKTATVLLILLFPASVIAQVNRGYLISKNRYFEIKYNDTKSEIRTTANIKGSAYNFMIDCGAPAFISSEIQEKYKFKRIVHAKTKDVGGKTIYTDIVQIDTIRFGPFVFTDIPAIVFDIKNTPLHCYNVDGNIGSNILRHLIMRMDVRHNTVALTDNENLMKEHATDYHPMQLNGQSDVLFPIKINNDLTDTIHFDSGDGKLYTIAKDRAAKYMAQYPADVCRKGFGVVAIGIGGIGKSYPQYVLKSGSLQIGNDTISGARIYPAINNLSRMGRELLNYGVLTLDYTKNQYAFEKYTPGYIPEMTDYGFSIVIDDEKIYAGCVWENTPAALSGMESGDEILKINEVDLKSLPRCDREEMLKKQVIQSGNNAPVSITFKHRKGAGKTITLKKIPI